MTLAELRGSAKRNRVESITKRVLQSASLVSVVTSVAIVAVLATRGIGFLTEVDFSKLTESGWFPRSGRFDFVTIIMGSFWVTLIALAVATPIGIGASVYLG